MADDPLHDIIEAVRARLKTEVETQLQSVADRHQQELAQAEGRSQAELQALRAEIEEHKAAAAAAESARREAEQALATERHLAQARWEEERRTAAEQLHKLQQALQLAESGTSRAGDADRIATPAFVRSSLLLDGLREIDRAASVSEALALIQRTAEGVAGRSALFVANGSELDPWSVDGVASPGGALGADESARGIAAEALRSRGSVRENGSCAVPLLLDGGAVGVLYAEADRGSEDAGAWADEVEVVARHGAARIGYLTALRTAQARQWLAAATADTPSSVTTLEQEDTAASARRYARLLVSEIKLYNEGAVAEGRSRRDLLSRLGPEIERARHLYEERVPPSVEARSEYFQQELVQTLAGGDPSSLG